MGIQISGLLSNSAFDWKSVVDQLVAADGIPINGLKAEQTTNSNQSTALGSLKSALTDLQSSLDDIRSNNVFAARNVTSDVAATTWKSNSANGATVGNFKFAIQQLATAAQLAGQSDIGAGLSATSDVSGVTLANLPVATAVTAGTFTVNGQPVTIALTDSLQDVFDKISTATGGDVTGAYTPGATDGISLTSGSSTPIVLGAANDTSNFLSVMKLANNGSATVGSSAPLGTLKVYSSLASSGLRAAITAVDGPGNGSFAINGVNIAYNVNTDSLSTVLARINQSTAGVIASYDALADRVTITNKVTGDLGLGLNEPAGGLLDALGVTGTNGTLTRGQDAQFRVNNGALLTSHSNTLDASVHGIAGLSVTVDTETTQTLTVASDTASMQSAVRTFIDKFNAVQDFIDTNTKVDVSGTTVTTSVLSDNREIQTWARQLQSLAFNSLTGVTGSVKRLNDLGIDFDSTSGHLTVKDSDKFATALGDHPNDVQAFFLSGSSGLISKFDTYLNGVIRSDRSQQDQLSKANSDLAEQITALQTRLDAEREQLTNSFMAMLDAQSNAQSQNTYLTNTFFKSSS